MKNVHFFGCSFTAGDELTDDKFFPWKFTEEHTQQSYYEKRNMILEQMGDSMRYFAANKKLAYPTYIDSTKYKTVNHAVSGSSLRENVYNIIAQVESELEPIDAVYLQIPPIGREMIINNKDSLETITINSIYKFPHHQEYIMAKLKTHGPMHYVFDSVLDTILIVNYLKSKNIYHKIISFSYGVDLNDLNKLANSKMPKIFDTIQAFRVIPLLFLKRFSTEQYRLLGGHINLEGQLAIAAEIQRDLEINLK